MTSPPNPPRGSARVPGPEPDGPGGSRGPGHRANDPEGSSYGGSYGTGSVPGGRRRAADHEPPSGRYSSGRGAGVYGGEGAEPTTGRHSRGGSGTYGSPASGTYGSSSSGGTYGSPSSGTYGAPSSGSHGSAASGGTYGSARPSSGTYGSSSSSGTYGSPPSGSYGGGAARRHRYASDDYAAGARDADDYGEEPTAGRHSAGRSGAHGGAGSGGAHSGSASVGSASVGSASVGSASVGGAPVGSAGRASVRPPGPPGDDGDHASAASYGEPPRSRAEERRAQRNTGKARKKRRRRRRIVAGVAVLLLLAGIGTIGGAYYFTNVTLPDQLHPKVPSTIYYSDGKTQLAKLGVQNGSHVDVQKLPDRVKYAIVSAEDRSFYKNSGVDFSGILRAAFGHLMGDEDAGGASTITMQYAKLAEDPTQTHRTYTEKLKEAVVAMKLDQKYSKDEILGFYLDVTYFNRGAYGLQAAAQTYFGVDADKLTAEQAAVLAADIKDPSGFDPAIHPKAAKKRWVYVLKGMKGLGKYHKPVSLENYPKVKKPDGNGSASEGLEKPTGLIVKQVERELVDNGVFPRSHGTNPLEAAEKALRVGGYKIVTTIDKDAEKHAIEVATKDLKGQQKGLADALVSVEPGTGAVRAYFGGTDGTGFDTAGNTHQPGSSFKIYVLAAALMNGYSFDSYWNGNAAEKFDSRGGDGKVHNSEGEECHDGGVDAEGMNYCSLKRATTLSLNTVFYELTRRLGKAEVIRIAHEAGINLLVPTAVHGKKQPTIDLTKVSPEDAAQRPGIGYEIGFGQNPVTPLDHANGVATFANNGVYSTEHFIVSMKNADGSTKYKPTIKHRRVFSAAAASDISWVLQKVARHPNQFIQPKRPQANKTGTWQYGDSTTENSQAWTVGYVPKLACAVWVGQQHGDKPIKTPWGAMMYGSELPGTIWADFMSYAVDDLNIPSEPFPKPQHIGDPSKGQFDGAAPTPTPTKKKTPTSHPTAPDTGSPTPTGDGSGSPTPTGGTGSPTCNEWLGCPGDPGGPGPGRPDDRRAGNG